MKNKYIKCPICKGIGELPETKKKDGQRIIDNKTMIKLLEKEGYSYREIMRFMNFKSTRSVAYYLKEK